MYGIAKRDDNITYFLRFVFVELVSIYDMIERNTIQLMLQLHTTMTNLFIVSVRKKLCF